MAPMCVAGLLAGALFVCVCMMLLVRLTCLTQQVATLLRYDRDQLLFIKSTADEAQIIDYLRTDHRPPPLLANIPSELWHSPYDPLRKKHLQKRGCRGGVKLKKFFEVHWSCMRQVATLHRAVPRDRFVSRRVREGPCGWIMPNAYGTVRRFVPLRFQGRGADPRNLHCLRRMEPSIKELIPTKFALVNARSLGNKTFILNDFIGTNKLDILCGHIGLYCPTKINKAKTKRKSLVK